MTSLQVTKIREVSRLSPCETLRSAHSNHQFVTIAHGQISIMDTVDILDFIDPRISNETPATILPHKLFLGVALPVFPLFKMHAGTPKKNYLHSVLNLLSPFLKSLRGLSCEANLPSTQSHVRVECMDGDESAKVIVMYNILVLYTRSVV